MKKQSVEALSVQRMGRGPDLVMLHGWGVNSGVWQGVSEQLSQRFTLHLIDLPGFGVNYNKYPSEYSLFNLAQYIQEVMPEKSNVLGWSLGGLVAQHLALKFPQSVGKLIAVCSSPFFKQEAEWAGIKPKVLEAFSTQLSRNIDKTVERFLAIQAMGSPSLKADIRLLQASIANAPKASEVAVAKGLSLLETADLRHQLCGLTQRSLWLYGRLDTLVPVANAPQLKEILPAAEQVLFAKASHAPFISHPEEFCQAVERFLLD